MKATIVNFRRNRHTTSSNHMIIAVEGVDSRDKAEKLVGKEVVYATGKKDIKGKIASAHGNNGAIRAIFETGMPGQCLGKQVKIN
jgi:large subunit ribosomal protein L35Ae